jgi:hypothetical protein
MTETQQPAAKFLQAVTELEGRIQPYLSSYRCALVYVVEFDEKIVQLCIILHSLDVSEQHMELFYEPRVGIRIYSERMGVEDVFNLLTQFASKGVITLNGVQKEFIYSPNDLLIPQILEREIVDVYGKRWSSLEVRTECSQTLDKLCPTLDFSKLYSILREERGKSSLEELMGSLTRLPQFRIDSNTSPGITVLIPIYARIKRCGLTGDKMKFHIEIAEGLREKPQLVINILKFSPDFPPSSLKLSLACLKHSAADKQGFCYLSHEEPIERLDRIELDLKDHLGLSRSSYTLNVAWIKELQRKAAEFSRRAITIYLKKARDSAFYLAPSISVALSMYAAWYYWSIKTLPDPMTAVTVAMAIATVFMAYVSKKGLDVSRSERLKPLVEEALNGFLNRLKQSVETIIQGTDSDEPVSIDPGWLEPEPHLVAVTYEEAPFLLRKISKLLKAMLSYNVSIDLKDVKKLKNNVKETLRAIDTLKTKLSQKYWVKPSPEKISYRRW